MAGGIARDAKDRASIASSIGGDTGLSCGLRMATESGSTGYGARCSPTPQRSFRLPERKAATACDDAAYRQKASMRAI